MSYRAVGRLAEVAALGVLKVRLACYKRYFRIGEQRARERAAMVFFVKVGKHEALPVEIKHVFGQVCIKDQPRTLRLRLNEELYLRVVTKRLKVTDADCFSCCLFLVEYLACAERAVN